MAGAAAEAGFAMPGGALEEGRRRVLRATGPAATSRRPAHGRSSTAISSRTPACATRTTVSRRRCGCAGTTISPWTRSARITLETYEEATRYCGNRAPRSAIQAQFSLSYAVAAALVLGDLGPDAYADCRRDSGHRPPGAVGRRNESTRAASAAARQLTIDVGTKQLSGDVDGVAGDPGGPSADEEGHEKFSRYAEPTLGPQPVAALTAFVLEGGLAPSAGATMPYDAS